MTVGATLISIAVVWLVAEAIGWLLPGPNNGAWPLRVGFALVGGAVAVMFYARTHHVHQGPADGPVIDSGWSGSCALAALLGCTLVLVGVIRRMAAADPTHLAADRAV